MTIIHLIMSLSIISLLVHLYDTDNACQLQYVTVIYDSMMIMIYNCMTIVIYDIMTKIIYNKLGLSCAKLSSSL